MTSTLQTKSTHEKEAGNYTGEEAMSFFLTGMDIIIWRSGEERWRQDLVLDVVRSVGAAL